MLCWGVLVSHHKLPQRSSSFHCEQWDQCNGLQRMCEVVSSKTIHCRSAGPLWLFEGLPTRNAFRIRRNLPQMWSSSCQYCQFHVLSLFFLFVIFNLKAVLLLSLHSFLHVVFCWTVFKFIFQLRNYLPGCGSSSREILFSPRKSKMSVFQSCLWVSKGVISVHISTYNLLFWVKIAQKVSIIKKI